YRLILAFSVVGFSPSNFAARVWLPDVRPSAVRMRLTSNCLTSSEKHAPRLMSTGLEIARDSTSSNSWRTVSRKVFSLTSTVESGGACSSELCMFSSNPKTDSPVIFPPRDLRQQPLTAWALLGSLLVRLRTQI